MVVVFLSPSSGVINSFIKLIGQDTIDFMTKEQYWRSIYIISDIWKNTGWSSIIYLAALSGVDPQLHEAAHIDGASRVQRIWHINVPGIIPTAVLLFIMSCGQIMSVGFEKVYLLQNSLNLSVSEVISTYVYKTGLLGAKFSYTSAIGLFNSLINVTLLLIVNKISSKVSGIMLF
jgi:putative aldouronate transport system permease protein